MYHQFLWWIILFNHFFSLTFFFLILYCSLNKWLLKPPKTRFWDQVSSMSYHCGTWSFSCRIITLHSWNLTTPWIPIPLSHRLFFIALLLKCLKLTFHFTGISTFCFLILLRTCMNFTMIRKKERIYSQNNCNSMTVNFKENPNLTIE